MTIDEKYTELFDQVIEGLKKQGEISSLSNHNSFDTLNYEGDSDSIFNTFVVELESGFEVEIECVATCKVTEYQSAEHETAPSFECEITFEIVNVYTICWFNFRNLLSPSNEQLLQDRIRKEFF